MKTGYTTNKREKLQSHEYQDTCKKRINKILTGTRKFSFPIKPHTEIVFIKDIALMKYL